MTVHWGPNMVTAPSSRIRAAARALVDAGATIVAGHSAHVFHGVAWVVGPRGPTPVLYDLGDFVDDYAIDPWLRNDLGAVWRVEVEGGRAVAVEAVPVRNGFRFTGPAQGDDRAWIVRRLDRACREFGTIVVDEGDHLACRSKATGGTPGSSG